MGGIKNIAQGFINEALGNNQTIANPRRAICVKCPMYHINSLWGWAECNPKGYLDPKTNDFTTTPKAGYYKGCGCKIEAKITVPGEKCPAGKW